ncbi:DNA-formamidopyrimidine glycosylase family protein [Chitinophaga lutea]
MPEGPSIVILREELAQFAGKKVLEVSGNTKVPLEGIKGKKVVAFRSWGKHFLICFPTFAIRIHFLLFGTYRVNERKEMPPRLRLVFSNGEVNFYTSSIRRIEAPLDEVYDWSADVMSEQWDPAKALAKLKKAPDMLACDALLDQNIFAGSGNIIKNEVLFNIRVHPASRIGALPLRKRKELVKEVVDYSFRFLEWKKAYVLKKHWRIHTRKACPRCDLPVHKEYLGQTNRRTFFCTNCQELYE